MSGRSDSRSVLLAGATGLVGREILRALLADPTVSEIHVLGRRALAQSDPRVRVHVVAHFVDLARLPPLPSLDEVYLALGTTIRVAGSEAAFRAVDLDANLAVARQAAAAGATRAGLVSAVGADPQSKVFYNRVKGELEAALTPLFATLVIAQPSLLLGDRASLNQPLRWGERLSTPVARLVAPLLPGRYRPVEASAVAQALARTVPAATGQRILASDELAAIARG